MKKVDAKKIVLIGMFAAIAYVLTVAGHYANIQFVGVDFLKYDPKDIIIVIGGFIFGPLSVVAMSVIVSIMEMFHPSTTGFYGVLMNVLSTCAFAGTAALIYKKWRTLPGAVVGLVAGIIVTAPVMLLWNYFIVPLYMPWVTRDVIVPMLLSVFLPFNIIKCGINTAVTLLIYKSIRTSLASLNLFEKPTEQKSNAFGAVVTIMSVILLITLLFLVVRGVFTS